MKNKNRQKTFSTLDAATVEVARQADNLRECYSIPANIPTESKYGAGDAEFAEVAHFRHAAEVLAGLKSLSARADKMPAGEILTALKNLTKPKTITVDLNRR